jgi:hypothetical protein
MLHLETSRENPDRSLKPSPLDKPGFIEVSGFPSAAPVARNADVLVGSSELPTRTSAFVRPRMYQIREVQVLSGHTFSDP